MSKSEIKKDKWVVSGCTVTAEPGEQTKLLEWLCPEHHAAILNEYIIQRADDLHLEWSKSKDFTIELAFEKLNHTSAEDKYVYHRNPNPYSQHRYQTSVKMLITNHTDTPVDMWATLKGNHFPTTKLASIQPQAASQTPTSKSIPAVQKEKAMNVNDLSNSHDDIPVGSMPTLGVHYAEPASYGEGDVAPLHMDNKGRLLVAVDAMTEEAEEQLQRLADREAQLLSEVGEQTAHQNLKKQKVEQKYLIKSQEIGLEKSKSDADKDKDKELSKDEKHTKALVSSYRYEFLSTLARWAALAGSAITMTYFLS